MLDSVVMMEGKVLRRRVGGDIRGWRCWERWSRRRRGTFWVKGSQWNGLLERRKSVVAGPIYTSLNGSVGKGSGRAVERKESEGRERVGCGVERESRRGLQRRQEWAESKRVRVRERGWKISRCGEG